MATANVDAQAPETAALSDILSPGANGALAAVRRVRVQTGLSSTLPETELQARLARLLQWLVRDYAASGSRRLLSSLPEGKNALGQGNAQLSALQQTYWLQDNALYGAAALDQYAPVLGRLLWESWHSAWQRSFPNFCPDTQSDYVIGRLADYDRASGPRDPRCRFTRPGSWQFFREYQYPDPAGSQFDSLPRPIIGTDYPAGPHAETRLAPISERSPRDLLKYGCLRQVLLGQEAVARQMLDLALANWDGNGFVFPKNDPRTHSRLAGTYWTRDLGFALLCGNALGQGNQPVWGTTHHVAKGAMEQRLWSAQSQTGGIFTNYCGGNAEGRFQCIAGQNVPGFAKQTNEIAPIVLLAYGANIWRFSH
jgi:hypothetical protein